LGLLLKRVTIVTVLWIVSKSIVNEELLAFALPDPSPPITGSAAKNMD